MRESSPKSSIFATNNTSQHRDSLQNNDLRAIQRPQAKKIPPKNIGAIPPPPQREPATVAIAASNMASHAAETSSSSGVNILSTSMLISKKDPPPLPPPRPHRHGRSSSLDLNKFKIGTPSGTQPEVKY